MFACVFALQIAIAVICVLLALSLAVAAQYSKMDTTYDINLLFVQVCLSLNTLLRMHTFTYTHTHTNMQGSVGLTTYEYMQSDFPPGQLAPMDIIVTSGHPCKFQFGFLSFSHVFCYCAHMCWYLTNIQTTVGVFDPAYFALTSQIVTQLIAQESPLGTLNGKRYKHTHIHSHTHIHTHIDMCTQHHRGNMVARHAHLTANGQRLHQRQLAAVRFLSGADLSVCLCLVRLP